MIKHMLGAPIAVALLIAAPAAAARCWNSAEMTAAQVRDLQSRLMVAALRCRVSGHDVLKDYNAFVAGHRATLVHMNDRLKNRFFAEHGRAGGQREYDRFTTRLANAYGAGASSAGECADMAALARETLADRAMLASIAQREAGALPLSGGLCPMTIAAK